MATMHIATLNLTKSFERAAEVVAYTDLDIVLGQSTGDNTPREMYHVTLLKPGQRTIRLLSIPKNGLHPIPETVLADRPNCECINFQVKCLDDKGQWTGGICKHVAAKIKVMLSDLHLPAADKAPWLELLQATLPYVDPAAKSEWETLVLLNTAA